MKNFLKQHRTALFLIKALVLYLGFCSQAMAQQIIQGKVTDENNLPIIGANVIIQGTNKGVNTDIDGSFKIEAKRESKLEFTFMGYAAKIITVGSQTTINTVMEPDSKILNEVVVVGYGTQKKRDITGAVATVDVSKLKDIPASNVSRMLVGQTTGVTVRQATGAPGSEFEVTIRGMGSLGAGSLPLYVVDGFPIGNSVGQNLNPNDIESISILKDAVSTAIYGARGSNGVILITTKSAKAGETKTNVTLNYGFQNVPESRKIKMLNGQEFAQFKKDAFMDKIRYFENREPSISEVPLDYRFPEQTKNSTNWFDAILNQNAAFKKINITISNGKGDIKSLVSLGLIDQEGALINTFYKNYSLRANFSGKINDFISMGLNVNTSLSNENVANTDGGGNGGYGVVGYALLADPRESIYKADGSYNSFIGNHDGIFGFPNPVQMLNELSSKREKVDILTNVFLEFSILKNLKFKTAINAKLNYNSYKSFHPSTIGYQYTPPPSDASEYDDVFMTRNLSTDQLLTYDNQFGEHRLNVLLGFTAQEELVKGLSGSGIGYPDNSIPFLDAAKIKSASSTEYGWGMQAFFGRINYSFNNKYLFSGTLRREGSSRFGANNKYGFFPAFSAGWRISEESFIPKYSWLTDLKLRSSYGITGNNNIGNYSSLAIMNNSNYLFGNNYSNGKVVGSLANTELGWEKSNQLDIGLDLVLFNNKVTFSAEYYDKITSDMLLPVQLPSLSGFTSFLDNIGKVQNSGLEFALKYKTKINEIGFWSNFNISFNRNKVLEIRGENDEIWNGSMYDGFNVSKVGSPIGMLYGYKVLGIFQNQDEINNSPTQNGAIPGVYKYFDANGNGKIDSNTSDLVEIGNPWPKATWGFNIGGDYKNIDLNILFTGAEKYDLFRHQEGSTMNMDGVFNVMEDSSLRWRNEGNPGNGRLATTNTWAYERESSSRYVYDASHIWLKNISVGYTLPKSKIHFADVRVFLSADNLFLFTNYPGSNPEANTRGGISPGIDDESYPVARTFSIGANINF